MICLLWWVDCDWWIGILWLWFEKNQILRGNLYLNLNLYTSIEESCTIEIWEMYSMNHRKKPGVGWLMYAYYKSAHISYLVVLEYLWVQYWIFITQNCSWTVSRACLNSEFTVPIGFCVLCRLPISMAFPLFVFSS